MSESKHTPGPWSVVEQRGNRPAIYINGASPHGSIAKLYNRSNWQKDARVLAAAPDLLALARDLLLDHQTVEPHHHDTCETCRRANAIIARAEGRSDE